MTDLGNLGLATQSAIWGRSHRPAQESEPATGFRFVAIGLSWTVLVLGLAVLVLGWGAGIGAFARILPNSPAMVPGTAMCLVGLGAAQILALRGGSAGRLAGVLAAGFAAYGFFRILALIASGSALTFNADIMSLATMIGIVLGGLGQCARAAGFGGLGVRIDTGGLLLCVLALDAFLLSPEGFARSGMLAGMAAHTAIGLMGLFIAGLLAGPRGSWLETVLGPDRGSENARRILPLAVIGPILLAKTAMFLIDRGSLDFSLRVGGFSVLLVGLGGYLVVRNARHENSVDLQARLAEARLKQVLDGLETAVFVFDGKRSLRMSNRKANELCGGAEAAHDWLFRTKYHSAQDRRVLSPQENPAARLLAGHTDEDLYAGFLDGGKAERILRFSSRRQAELASGLPLTILSVVDETESWNMRAFLAQQERMDLVAQLSGGIAHDISNILGAIRLAADTGALGDDADRTRRSLTTIQAACQRGAQLTERLTRMTHQSEPGETTLDAVTAISDALQLARPTVPAFIDLDADLPEAPCPVNCDRSDLESAVLNLIINARAAIIEAGRTGGRIRVDFSAGETTAVLRVSDDGPGMGAEVLNRATEPFFTTRRADGGSGLGLAMVAAFADREGGRFTITSEVGRGTTATLTLPRTDKQQADEEHAVEENLDLTGLRIVVVEDDPQFHEALVQALRFTGAEVREAVRYADGLAILESGARPDLLLTDVILPGVRSGLDLADAAERLYPDIPVVFLSGFAGSFTPDILQRRGVFLRKPVNFAQLVNTIRLLKPELGGHASDGV